MDYKDKYLKYKKKYLCLTEMLSNQTGGAAEEEKIRRKYIKKDTPFFEKVNFAYDTVLAFLKNNKPDKEEYKKLINNLSYMIRNTVRKLKQSKEELFVISDIVYDEKKQKTEVGSKKLEPYLDAEIFLSKKKGDKYLEADSFKIRL